MKKISKLVRAAAGMSNHPCPIHLVDGFGAPKVEGRSYYWTTKTGIPIRYPSAYAKFGRPVYHASTLRITVGRGWLAAAQLAVI